MALCSDRILIFHKRQGVMFPVPELWFLTPGTTPPSAHPFSRASLGRGPRGCRCGPPVGLVAQLVRARA